MSITQQSLDELRNHWMIKAIDQGTIDRAFALANQLMVSKQQAWNKQIHFDYPAAKAEDYDLLKRVALAYEIAGIEGLADLLSHATDNSQARDLCKAASFQSFELYRVVPVPEDKEQAIFHVLHLCALAYCGERSVDLGRWLNEHESLWDVQVCNCKDWAERILFKLYMCWVRLFHHRDWRQLTEVAELVHSLREDQKHYEEEYLQEEDPGLGRSKAILLVALYHWATATEKVAEYMLNGQHSSVNQDVDKHFESAIEAVSYIGDRQLEVLLKWMRVATKYF